MRIGGKRTTDYTTETTKQKKMRKTIISMLFAAAAATATAGNIFSDLTYDIRVGYNIGGTSPMGMPATIRSLDAYRLTPSFALGLGVYKPLNDRWGLTTGLRLENKGMNMDATVKNYHMKITQGGSGELEGVFTGKNHTEVEQWMLTLPLQATWWASKKVCIKAGPYFSYVNKPSFTGYAYNGYLRVNPNKPGDPGYQPNDPTGDKMLLGEAEGERGDYDFSDDLRSWQWGMAVGADWHFSKRWGVYADLTWGFTGIFNKDFTVLDQKLYPIYGTIGVSYRLR